MAWVAICERLRPNMGRNENQTYANVVVKTQRIDEASVAAHLAAFPSSVWNDPLFNEFIIDLTDQEAADINNLVNPLTWDQTQNNPRWQQENAPSGSTKAFGSFADLADDGSAFTLDDDIPDNRFIIRIYTLDPVANPGTAVHVAAEEFDEGVAGASVERFVRLFQPDDTPSNTNAGNQRTDIGGKLVDFDFGSSGGLSAGVASINFGADVAGRGEWPSNHRYRIAGPAGEKLYSWSVFTKTLRISPE